MTDWICLTGLVPTRVMEDVLNMYAQCSLPRHIAMCIAKA